ncbi:MAG: phosphotransferase [Paludibacteraceae bacterium]|nr:phosphotransferase [Paludibacteraceae bacterium]
MQSLTQLFYKYTGVMPDNVEQLSASGSNRRYFRFTAKGGQPSADGGQQTPVSLIGVQGTSAEENHAFLYMDKHFLEHGLNVPRVVAQSDDEMIYLQEDLGDTLLFNYIAEGRKTGVFCEAEKQMLRKTMRALARFQVVGSKDFDYNQCYPQPEFNLRSINWDLNYFKYCFLKATGLEFQEDRLESDFERLAYILLKHRMTTFMYRDFQSRNVMIHNGEPWFIDFQGGRRGPVYYDVASFLWQAKANFHQDLREELIEVYLNELELYLPINRQEFHETLRHFVLFRTMQVLGAYGFRGYFEKKPHFLQSIPFAIENLRALLKDCTEDYPYLIEVLHQMTEMKQFKEISVRRPLVVRVYSFSYKKGIPADESGNGGGFVFDCRAVNNPGKYERYKYITGQEEPVIKFLEDDGEIFPFLDAAYTLVDASVKRYIDRGFQNLMVSFGCTGGQHRSVYAAEKMAKHINDKFGVEVQLIHREQNIENVLPAKEITKKRDA